jgi:regulator of sigma D
MVDSGVWLMSQVDDKQKLRLQLIVEELLHERQQMLVTFCRVAGLEPYTEDKPVAELLQEFCQVLVDYISLGHFEVFPRIEDDPEPVSALAGNQSIYQQIADVTKVVVDFNDRYDPGCDFVLEELPQDLSRLGEALAQRIELEDCLLKTVPSVAAETEDATTTV